MFSVPTPSGITLSPTGWTNGSITVSNYGVSDTLSGVDHYEWGYAGQSNKVGNLNGTINPEAANGRYIWVRAVDAVGNVGAAAQSTNPYYRDILSPSIPTSASLSVLNWDTGLVSVSASGSVDNTSGPASGVRTTYQWSTDAYSGICRYSFWRNKRYLRLRKQSTSGQSIMPAMRVQAALELPCHNH